MTANEKYEISRFEGALELLPKTMRQQMKSLYPSEMALAEEIRIRIGQAITVLVNNREIVVRDEPVTKREIDWIFEVITQASAYSVNESLKAGFITVKGGRRIGVCGMPIVYKGEITGIKNISSLSIRVSRQIKDIASELSDKLCDENGFSSTLIVSLPGGGKTTLLRDTVRILSTGQPGRAAFRVGLVDDRGEIAAMWDGEPQMDIGPHTDVIASCPKADAMLMLLRAMNPQIIAVDEITAPEDVRALITAAHCGTGIIATAHASNLQDLKNRKLYREMLDSGVFQKIVMIEKTDNKRQYHIYDVEELQCSGL